MAEQVKKKSKKRWIIPLSIVGGLVLTFGILFLVSTFNTQMVVGAIQKVLYSDNPINTYDPLFEPHNGLKDNGQYLISEIRYDEEYPNSFLDITYTNENVEEDRPTLFYFHGGGFFGGSKNMADPMAASDATALIDDICAQGFNIVNVDYALVPDYRFPVPVIQTIRAIEFINNHKDEYHLNIGYNIDIFDFCLSNEDMNEISKLNKHQRRYIRTDEALENYLNWKITYEEK